VQKIKITDYGLSFQFTMKKKHWKTLLRYLPEGLLLSTMLAMSFPYRYTVPALVPLLPALLLVALLIWKNRYLALFITAVFALGIGYMFLALLSEFHEFPAGDPGAAQMLATGGAIFLSAAILVIIMPIKYFSTNARHPQKHA
jgi:hypothetical protein